MYDTTLRVAYIRMEDEEIMIWMVIISHDGDVQIHTIESDNLDDVWEQVAYLEGNGRGIAVPLRDFIDKFQLKITESTPQRGGYGDVWMNDPRMSFREGSRVIELRRRSGGGVAFGLLDHEMITYTTRDIHSKEQFDKLWEFIEGSL